MNSKSFSLILLALVAFSSCSAAPSHHFRPPQESEAIHERVVVAKPISEEARRELERSRIIMTCNAIKDGLARCRFLNGFCKGDIQQSLEGGFSLLNCQEYVSAAHLRLVPTRRPPPSKPNSPPKPTPPPTPAEIAEAALAKRKQNHCIKTSNGWMKCQNNKDCKNSKVFIGLNAQVLYFNCRLSLLPQPIHRSFFSWLSTFFAFRLFNLLFLLKLQCCS